MAIALADGRTLTAEVGEALGCPDRPLGEPALVEKFVDCARRAAQPLGEAGARALAKRILEIESCRDVGMLFQGGEW
jgi:hypothetical protein